jgi:hypothetical protein
VLIYAHKTSFWKSLFVKKMKQHYVLSLYNIVSKKKNVFFWQIFNKPLNHLYQTAYILRQTCFFFFQSLIWQHVSACVCVF